MRKREAPPEPPTQRMTPADLKASLAGARKMAKPSCKRCYGTGVMGTRIVSLEKKTILICPCVEKMANRIRAAQVAKVAARGAV